MAQDDQHPPMDDRRTAHAPAERAPYGTTVGRGDRSLGDLFKELGRETQTLIRQEVQLAKTEAQENAAKAGKHVGMMAAGGFVAYAGFLALVAALGFLLGSFMPTWLGFLIAGALVVIVGAMLLQSGRKGFKNTDFTFDRTAETLQEDALWMKQEAQEIKDDPAHLGADR